jgi:hypothetical protein
MPAIMEFWVNNHQGMPYFVVSGEVNEKLGEMLSDQISEKISRRQARLFVLKEENVNSALETTPRY